MGLKEIGKRIGLVPKEKINKKNAFKIKQNPALEEDTDKEKQEKLDAASQTLKEMIEKHQDAVKKRIKEEDTPNIKKD